MINRLLITCAEICVDHRGALIARHYFVAPLSLSHRFARTIGRKFNYLFDASRRGR